MCTILAEHLVKTMNDVGLINVEVVVPVQYYDLFMMMVNKGVFNQKNAAVTLHFDQNGILQNIQRADFLFSRKHDK